MAKELLYKNINELLDTIEVCINNKILLPSLILLYSGIDIMSYLNLPENRNDVNRKDFIKWVDKYVLPDSNLICSALDLYAARCSVLHSYTPESTLSRENKAKKIFYSWGKAKANELQKLINNANNYPAIAIHINELFNAFRQGVLKYLNYLEQDNNKSLIVYRRANKFFTDVPASKVKKLTPPPS